jgi:hypothetical protein
MIPLPVYIAAAQPNLAAGYDDFVLADAQYAGLGTDVDLWTTSQVAELDRDVQEAYGWCLYPQTIPGERVPHVWTWTEQTTTLTTVLAQYNYTLPADFGSLCGQYMYWPSGSAYDPPYRTNDGDILFNRQHSTTSGRPQFFAIRWLAQTAGLNQRQEVIFWPTPDAEYVLTYRYAVLTGRLSKTNPYPLGGPRMAVLMREACKAIGETKKNGVRGDQWGMFMAALQSAIQLDKGTNTTPTVGMMRGSGYGDCYPRGVSGTAKYYFGPNAAGAYSLEV